jgi:hypothetical protein
VGAGPFPKPVSQFDLDRALASWIYWLPNQKHWEESLAKDSFIYRYRSTRISFSTAASAANAEKHGATSMSVATNQPRKVTYERGMQAHWGAGCKMSGSC